ncbi:MAG TPA: hypothetical protein VFC59_08510, partial [Cryobacterium sp.]|nr:hypothetical protein [Cryobacterium sp.]
MRDTAVDAAAAGDLFARAAWTGIAEPGDGTAGLLVSRLGAGAALTAVLDTLAPGRRATTARGERGGPGH